MLSTAAMTQQSIVLYSFDACSGVAVQPGLPPLQLEGQPACECGLGMNSMKLDGSNDVLRLPAEANSFLKTDFTLDFYFWMEKQPGETDIFSHRFGCNSLDSLMALRYFSDTDEFLFELASDVGNYHSVRYKVDNAFCWHRFTLIRFGLEYRVYFDNVLAKKIIAREEVVFSKRASLVFADSPCNNNNNAKKYAGRIDEIQLFNGALSDQALKQSFTYPDRIITENTTIFQGQSITLESGASCDDPIVWSPAANLDNAASPNPVLTPDQTATYTLTVNHSNCISRDTVRIFVADRDKLDCDNLPLPKAFTPNNDRLNDQFGISNTFLLESLESFEIYTRWGARVWQTNQAEETWDGISDGKPMSGGVYLYKILYTCNGEQKTNVGSFTLLR